MTRPISPEIDNYAYQRYLNTTIENKRHPAKFIATSALGLLLGAYSHFTMAYGAEQSASEEVPTFTFSDNGIRHISPDVYVPFPPPGKKTPQREPDIDQEKLLRGEYALGYVLEAGQNQFNFPFTAEHGHGEGAKGPRSKQRAIWNPRGGTVDDPAAWPFLRVNGIDSQSCFECHNSIGVETPLDSKAKPAHVRKPSAQGGPAGAANTAFINDQFPEHLAQLLVKDPAKKAVMTKFARNPPHVFGTGYTQRLATEMSTELKAQTLSTMRAAQNDLHTPKTITLQSKGVQFGEYTVTCASKTACTIDDSQVVGVQKDFVVRPFQWGGIASSVRHFARDALDFHFSVQAVEKVGHKDCDLDGLSDEITVGNVSALTSYVAMFRPPSQEIAAGMEKSVAEGQKLFEKIGCDMCHRTSMTITNPTLTVLTPPPVAESEACPREVAQLTNTLDHIPGSAQEALSRIEHVFDEFENRKTKNLIQLNSAAQWYDIIDDNLHSQAAFQDGKENYEIDLSLKGFSKADVPAYVWPRLPEEQNGQVHVPLFSDLKLHYMGKQLSDDYAQPVDVEGYQAEPGFYVTRVLWGIADTAPYMHDGRARTLEDAIALHSVEGSDAKRAGDKFKKLSKKKKQAVLDFLNSLKLPVAEGVEAPEYVSN